ncbi:MAG: ribonuclease H-like domain-containing protein [Candidatus Bathyarchaeota archaeon]|nr:ribonuclease H-like domain-containing protein [Candidatus Bathyarchaeota archaeon]
MKSLPNQWLDAEYAGGNDSPLIRWANEEKVIRISSAPFFPYFFIHEKDLPKAGNAILRNKAEVEKGDYVSVRGHKCVKIICKSPSDVHRKRFGASLGLRPQLESIGVATFEADIPFVRRVMIDEDIRQSPIKHRCSLDIEVDARKGFPVPEKAEFRIISIAIVGDDKREYFFSFEDERDMILQAYEVLNKRYGLVTAWNWKKFDGKYLINRTRKLKLKAKLFPIQEMDAMLNYTKLTLWGFIGKTYRLEAVAKRHLGIDHSSMKSKMDAERLWASFVGDKKELREYNLMDARLVVMLDELLKLSEPYMDIASQYPIMLRDAPLMSMVLETILLREASKSTPRLVFPNREHKTANLLGGFTLKPKAGVYKGVLSLDYKSLYPTTMATFKLSPELVMLYKSWKESGLNFNQWVERAFGRI